MNREGIVKTALYVFCALHYSMRESLLNLYLDLKYSGRLLTGNSRSSYRHLGANDVYHTVYPVMFLIFRLVPIQKSDVLVDVGCGKGRVINFWLSRKLSNKIVGLELDPDIANATAEQFAKYGNVSILAGDAREHVPPDATIFYFYNPFSAEKVAQFESVLSVLFRHKPITLIYYNPKSIHVFENGNWEILNIDFEKDLGKKPWGRINCFHKLAILKNKVQ
jgi:hypothetical protein